MFRKDASSKGFEIDPGGETDIVHYTKNSYTPINVYKIPLKIALSVIPDNYIREYKKGFAFLRSKVVDLGATDYANILSYQLPCRVSTPRVILFKRKEVASLLPTHSFALYFENLLFTFPVPFNNADIEGGIYEQDLTIPICPPIYSEPLTSESKYTRAFTDLSSYEIRKGDQGNIIIRKAGDNQNYQKGYDPETKNTFVRALKSEDIIGIHLVFDDKLPNFPQEADAPDPY